MYIKVSWDKEFEELMLYLKLKYKDRMFDADGIGDNALDLNKFSKAFFTNNTTTADVSVDANSNVTAKTSVEYTFELPKPLKRLNSYFLLWKQLRKQFDIDFANKVIEMQLSGDIYINDFTDIAMPYSYHPGTTIILRNRNDTKNIIHMSMESLFKEYEIYSIKYETYEEIDLKPHNFEIFEENRWVPLERVLRHITDKCLYRFESNYGNVFTVTSDHPCILSDGSEKYAEDVNLGDQIKTINLCGFKNNNNNNFVDHKKAYNIGTTISDIEYTRLPSHYLNWTTESKYALLSGIVDANGTVDANSGAVYIQLTNLGAVQQIAELATNLSFTKVKTVLEDNLKENAPVYGVLFNISEDCTIFNYSTKLNYNKEIILNRTSSIKEPIGSDEIIKKEKISFDNRYVYDVTTGSGRFYTNGIIAHNCFNYSTNDVAYNGLKGISRRLDVKPPKSFNTFIRQVEQFVVYAANSTLGATGLADILVVGSHYVRKIKETGYDGHVKVNDLRQYLYEILVNFIYTLNWEYRGNQSPFTNISVYDDYFLDNFIKDYHSPIDGQPADKEIIKFLQDIFIDAMNDELSRNPITFPVTTACFSIVTQEDLDSGNWGGYEINEAKDKDFVRYIAEKNKKFCFINMYAGETSQLSSC